MAYLTTASSFGFPGTVFLGAATATKTMSGSRTGFSFIIINIIIKFPVMIC